MPKKNRIKCIEIEEIYESISHASRALQIPRHKILYAIEVKKTCGGMTFEIVKD